MTTSNWIIKNTTNCTFFTLLSGGTFVTELELAQRFTNELDAMLCIEQNIDSDEAFAKFGFEADCFPAPLIENGMTVKYRAPEDAEEKDLLFTVIDASNQDRILVQAVNSSLALPPVEGLNSLDLTVVTDYELRNINAVKQINAFGFNGDKTIGTDASLAECISEGYLMTEEVDNIKADTFFKFFAFVPDYILKENGKTKPELMTNTECSLRNLIDTYKCFQSAIDSFAGTPFLKTRVSGYKSSYDVLNLADIINAYCGINN